MKGTVHIYTTAARSSPSEPWRAAVLIQSRAGKRSYHTTAAIPARGPSDRRVASFEAMLLGLADGRKRNAREAILYSDDPMAVEAMNRRARVSLEAAGPYLQVRAMAHTYRNVEFRYANYPAISDLPVMAAGC